MDEDTNRNNLSFKSLLSIALIKIIHRCFPVIKYLVINHFS